MNARGVRKRVDVVLLAQIKVDDVTHGGYQRPINENKAIEMALTFSWDEFHLIYVNVREGQPDVYWVVDGQHRLAALDLTDRHIEKKYAPALIYYGLTREEEARLYTSINVKRKNLHPVYAWEARSHYDEVVQHINRLVATYEFKINAGGGRTGIAAVGTLESIYDNFGPQTLASTLCVIRDAWNHDEKTERVLLAGLGLVLGCHERELDRAFIARRLARWPIRRWTAMAREHALTEGGSQPVVMARIITTELNKTRGGSRGLDLPSFDEVYAKFMHAKRSSAQHLAYERTKLQLHSTKPKPGSWIRHSRVVAPR